MFSRSYKTRYSGEAIEDLSAIVKHYEEISGSLKPDLRGAVLNAEEDLLQNPFAFSKINFKYFRRIFLKKFPEIAG